MEVNGDYDNSLLYRKIFYRQVVFSISMKYFGEKVANIIREGIIYNHFPTRKYRYYLSRSDQGYYDIKDKLSKIGFDIDHSGSSEWISFADFISVDPAVSGKVEGSRLSEMDGVLMHTCGIVSNERLYRLLHITKDYYGPAMERLLKAVVVFDEAYSPDVFRIEEVTEPDSYLAFLKKRRFRESLIQVEISIPFEGHSEFIIKNQSPSKRMLSSFNLTEDGVELIPIFGGHKYAGPVFAEIDETITDAFERFYYPLSATGECDGKRCHIKLLYERKRLSGILSLLHWLRSKGAEILLEKIESVPLGDDPS